VEPTNIGSSSLLADLPTTYASRRFAFARNDYAPTASSGHPLTGSRNPCGFRFALVLQVGALATSVSGSLRQGPGIGLAPAGAHLQSPGHCQSHEGERGATSRPVPPRRAGPRLRAHFPPQVRQPPWPGADPAVSLGRIGPPADVLKPGNVRIVSYGSVGSRGRRALLPVPQFQVAQNSFNHGAVADQADDFERAGAARTNQWVRFVHFLISRAHELLNRRVNSSAQSPSSLPGGSGTAGGSETPAPA
jgi:hypothetical protein